MKTVGRYSTTDQAHLAKMKLGAGGVDGYLFDEYMIQMDWLYSDAIGGVRLVVRDEDAAPALEILREPAIEEGVTLPSCPVCSSDKTRPDELPRKLAFLSILFLGAPLICIGRQNRCGDCNISWSVSKYHEGGRGRPGGANQYLGAQIMILGGILVVCYLVSFLGLFLWPLPDLWAAQEYRDFQIRESFSFTEMNLVVPVWVLLIGIGLLVTGISILRPFLRKKE